MQVYVDDALDDALEAEAERRGVSRAAVIRAALARELGTAAPRLDDAWAALAGQFTDGGVTDIDEVVYGPRT